MGVELVNRFAPGHQYVVQTHTDQPHAHNHILINPVSIETGKRIQNKLGHIETLRNINDEIARERGLSVLPPQEKLRRPGPNEHVRRINQYRGRSYIVDMASKAHFAREHATGYEEYAAILSAFDVQVRIEPKNITYFYPGKEHGKRGRNLDPRLDKPALEQKFAANRARLVASPERSIKRVRLVCDQADAKDPALVRFRDELADALNPFSIDVSMAWEPSREFLSRECHVSDATPAVHIERPLAGFNSGYSLVL